MVIILLILFIRVLSSGNRWVKGEELSTNDKKKMLQKQSEAKSRSFCSPSVVSTNPWTNKISALSSVLSESRRRLKSPVMSVKCLAETHPLKRQAYSDGYYCPHNDPSLNSGDKNTQNENHSAIDSPWQHRWEHWNVLQADQPHRKLGNQR